MKVVSFAGQARMGKDCCGDYVSLRTGWKKHSLATPVKKIFCESFDVTLEFVEEWKPKNEIPPGFNSTVRKGLQNIGDGFRQIQGDIWIKKAFSTLPPDGALITDARYPNELKKCKEVGGLNVLLFRPGYMSDDPNGSEALIKKYILFFNHWESEGFVTTEVIKFCYDKICQGSIAWPYEITDDLLEEMSVIDIFIKNDSDINTLHCKINDYVLPKLGSL